MSGKNIILILSMTAATLILSHGWTVAADNKVKPLKPVPKTYANKHMPKGWWTNPKIIEEGEKIFYTTVLEYRFKRKTRTAKEGCATCHGIDPQKDRTKKRGSPDFRISERVNRFSDSYWFWRISEGVAKTRMPPFKDKLSEEEIWKVIAYQHTWSHGNKPAVHDHKEIEHSVEK
ncbi:MAG: c-type cytochrome [Nitrospiria bacterium]